MMAAMDHDEGMAPGGGDAEIVPIAVADPLLVLFRQNYEPMVRTATAMLGDRARAEEVVQEAFVKVDPVLGRIPLDGHVAYLRRAVMNGARSVMRHDHAKKRQAVPLREHSSTPEDEAVRTDDQRRMIEALDRLPDRQRQCLVLRYYDGLTDAEVAAALGISAGSAKTHIRRGLEALKQKVVELR